MKILSDRARGGSDNRWRVRNWIFDKASVCYDETDRVEDVFIEIPLEVQGLLYDKVSTCCRYHRLINNFFTKVKNNANELGPRYVNRSRSLISTVESCLANISAESKVPSTHQ